MTRAKFLIAGAALIAAPAAFAQTAPQTTPTPQATAPATPATPAPATDVTDAEVTQFATIALAVNKIRGDTTLSDADKNAKMAEAVTASGMPLARFNAIGQAMQSDPALNTRIQTAAAAQQDAAQ